VDGKYHGVWSETVYFGSPVHLCVGWDGRYGKKDKRKWRMKSY